MIKSSASELYCPLFSRTTRINDSPAFITSGYNSHTGYRMSASMKLKILKLTSVVFMSASLIPSLVFAKHGRLEFLNNNGSDLPFCVVITEISPGSNWKKYDDSGKATGTPLSVGDKFSVKPGEYPRYRIGNLSGENRVLQASIYHGNCDEANIKEGQLLTLINMVAKARSDDDGVNRTEVYCTQTEQRIQNIAYFAGDGKSYRYTEQMKSHGNYCLYTYDIEKFNQYFGLMKANR